MCAIGSTVVWGVAGGRVWIQQGVTNSYVGCNTDSISQYIAGSFGKATMVALGPRI